MSKTDQISVYATIHTLYKDEQWNAEQINDKEILFENENHTIVGRVNEGKIEIDCLEEVLEDVWF